MRKLLIRAVAALAATASIAALHQGIADGQELVPGLVDVAVTIESKPTTVSPPGELALYAATVTNNGLLAAASTLTITLAPGAAYRDDLSTASCSGSGTTVTCPVPSQASGAVDVFDVVAATPITTGLKTTTANVVVNDGVVEPLEYTANNTSSTTTDVQPLSPTLAAGLVEEGDSLTLDIGDGRVYRLTVPEGVPGVIVRKLAGVSGTGRTCGLAGPCGNGFVIDFVQHPYFKAEDPTNPLETDRTYGPQDPCRGLGACADMYWAKSELQLLLDPMPFCAGAGPGGEIGTGDALPESPCRNQKYKVGGIIWHDVRMLSNDPVDIPPLGLGR